MIARLSLNRFPLLIGIRLAFGTFVSIVLTPANAQNATWTGNGIQPGLFSDPTNWSPLIVPTGTATFGPSTSVGIAFIGSVGTLKFLSSAPPYSFSSGLPNTTIELNGAGIVNNSTNSPFFNINGTLNFTNSSSSGNATIYNNVGSTDFLDSSNAGNATITVGGFASSVAFHDSSRAGTATITSYGNVQFGSLLGSDTASADHATIISNTDNGSISTIAFLGHATAGNATITTNDRNVIDFYDHSTGGQARFVLNNQSSVDFSLSMGPLGDGNIAAGSIEGIGRVFLGSDSLSVGSNNLSATLNGVIQDGGLSGATGGSLIKVGTGALTLTAINTYTGNTTINDGTLQIGDVNSPGARIAGSVVVTAAATLRGHGSIGGNVTNSGGTVAPGGSIGTLTMNGNYTQAGGILGIEVGPAAASLLNVGGAANLSNAAALVLTFDPGNYPAQQSFTILHSASLVGSLASVTQSGLPPSRLMNLTQTATDLILTLSSSLIAASTPATPNQLQVTSVLNNVFGSATGNLLAVHDALLGLSTAQQQQALTEISGVILASAPTVAVGQAQGANNAVLDRVFSGAENATVSGAQSAVPLRLAFAGSQENLNQLVAQARAAMEDDATSAARTISDGFWLQGAGDWGSVNGNGNAPGWSSHGGGVLAGYEHVFWDESRLGAAFGYGRADGDEKGDKATTSLDTYRLVFYGGFDDGPLMMGGALDFAVDRFGAERPIALGTLTPVATSSHDGNEISASAMAGYRLLGSATGVMPFISADYVYLHQQGFTETGAGALNLSVMPRHFQSLQPEVGVRVGHVFALEDNAFIVPVLTIGFRYELLDTTANNSALLASATSAGAFTTDGVALDRAMAHIGAKIVVHMRGALDLYAAYDARLSGNRSAQTAGLGVRYQF